MLRLVVVVGFAALLSGCLGQPTASTSLSPVASPSGTHPGPGRCHTSEVELAIASESGAAGHIGLDFEVRNASGATCTLLGYFGLALLTSDGKVGIAAKRSTSIFTAHTGPPHLVTLPPRTSALPASPAHGTPTATAGHAHFAATYSDVCDNNPAAASGNAWQYIAPDDTEAASLLEPGGQRITICSLEETPVQENPPTP